MRALQGKADKPLLDDDGKPFPKDSDGSAKVAQIGIDRSLAAWTILRRHFPDGGDEILDILVLLVRLQAKVDKTFPAARAFHRPGFDD